MSPNRQDIQLLFLEALEKETPEERASYLSAVCGDDMEMRKEFESLLRAYEDSGEVLESGSLGFESGVFESPHREGADTAVGAYRLIEKIGEGGMAVVYEAEQEEPLRRRVALKLIKPGMDTKQVVARFELERQALALMDHPGIAKVFEAGATDVGRPYFVMELVRGPSITEYCNAHRLTTQERLDLFMHVCKAIQHAHERGVIHRDIKPSNVLVVLQDGSASPKIIDFGIAKAMRQRLTNITQHTEPGFIIGTLEYMSPEQTSLEGSQIDVRSDVYALGILLYELLVGSPPFKAAELRDAPYDEMCRMIREVEPLRPSASLDARGETAGEVAESQGAKPDQLRKVLQGDLDWIILKAIEKDRNQRYQTVGELAADIERYLAELPITAGPPSRLYRLRKAARRHRTKVVAATLVISATVFGAAAAKLFILNSRSMRPQHAEGMTQRHVWNLPFYATPCGKTSADGRYLSYVDWIAGNLGIYDAVDKTHRLLTHNSLWADTGGWVEDAIVSPDGRQIAYSWCREAENNHFDLRLIQRDGIGDRLLYGDKRLSWITPYDWSPDGRHIVACLKETDQQLLLAKVDVVDGSVQPIVTLESQRPPENAFFSPDGRQVAYDVRQTPDGPELDLWVVDVAAGLNSPLAQHAADDRLMGWSPDGAWVLFVTDRTGPKSLWGIPVAEGAALGQAVPIVQQFEGGPLGFAQDGVFYYSISNGVSDLHLAEVDRGSLTPTSSPALVSERFVGRTGGCSWSPDGQLLAYSADVGSGVIGDRGPKAWALVVLDMATGSERLVTPAYSIEGTWHGCLPRWSQDGQSLLILGRSEEHGVGPHVVDVATGATEFIGGVPCNINSQIVWDRTRNIFFVRTKAGPSEPVRIMRFDRSDLSTTEIYRGTWASGLDLSPDGQWLAFWEEGSTLMTLSTEGGPPREILERDDGGNSDCFVRWAPDGRSLLFPKRWSELWMVDVETGRQQSMNLEGGELLDATLSPDGDQIAFTARQFGYQVWVLEDFLPE
jgi:serine/threonine protein kinase/Tol biopolymer transport system component